MKPMLFVLLVTGSLLAAGGLSQSRGQEKKPDPAALQKRLTELEQRIAALQREAAALRKELDQVSAPKVVVLTPQEAVEAYRKNPNQPVTAAFGVEPGSGNFRTGWRDQLDPIWATWDGRLVHKLGVAKFTAVLTPKAYMGLKIPSKKKDQPAVKPPSGSERAVVGRYLDENGLQVTGLVRVNESAFGAEYYIVVDDPSKVVLH